MMYYLLVGIYDITLSYCIIICQAFEIGMSIGTRHVRQVKTDSLTQAITHDVVWTMGLDEIQTIMNVSIILDHEVAS